MSITSEFRHAFNFYRGNGFTAARAIAGARLDAANYEAAMAADDRKRALKFLRYTSSPWRKPVGNGVATDGKRWIENPAAMGLRFVGYCDDIRKSIGHTGWFTDAFQDSKIRGTVYQLPGRNGKARFVAAHDNEDNGAADCGGPALVDFSTIYEEATAYFEPVRKTSTGTYGGYSSYTDSATELDACRDAASAADELTRIEAEHEREYQTAWQAGSDYAACLDELTANRKETLQTIRDMKGACALIRQLPASLQAAVRSAIESALEARTEIFEKMEKLKSGDYRELCFYPGATEKSAFNEGAGKPVL